MCDKGSKNATENWGQRRETEQNFTRNNRLQDERNAADAYYEIYMPISIEFIHASVDTGAWRIAKSAGKTSLEGEAGRGMLGKNES